MEVQWTGHLSYFASFLEVNTFLLQDHSTRLGLDLDQTHSGIWSSQVQQIVQLGPLELAGSSQSPLESVGKWGGV